MTTPPDLPFLDHLAAELAGAWPDGGSAEDRANAARAALEAMRPRDLIEAMLAARMLAAHHASMDGYRRAMQPDTSDADAIRLRNNAIAAARSFDTALRTLEKRQEPAEAASQPRRQPARSQRLPPTQPAASDTAPPEADAPMPPRPQYVPRNRHGEPIALWRWEDMTMSQRRAAYGDPDNEHLRAIAIAEEEAMIEAERRGPAAEQDGTPHGRNGG
jgi:hypothetical protein